MPPIMNNLLACTPFEPKACQSARRARPLTLLARFRTEPGTRSLSLRGKAHAKALRQRLVRPVV